MKRIIKHTIRRGLLCLLLAALLLSGCAPQANPPQAALPQANPPQTALPQDGGALGNGWQPEDSLELQYARNFSVDYYSGGYTLLTISDGSRFLLVPEEGETPRDIDGDIQVLDRPVADIYLVSTAVMSLFDALDALDRISLTGTQAEDWYVEGARQAMEAGEILFAGKYNAPDYELILASGCRLSVQSSMILHAPEVGEKLEELGIPVLVDQSSYEDHPLGRAEWIKFYGALVGREEEAAAIFAEQAAYLESVAGLESSGKTVVFFYINSSGQAVVRRNGDYVTRMIQLAGGGYAFGPMGEPDSTSSTVTLEMEEFYATAKDADVIFYNSVIGGDLASLDELVEHNGLLADFAAVQSGAVWCTGKNFYQETTRLGLMTLDIRRILTEEDPQGLHFFHRLEG